MEAKYPKTLGACIDKLYQMRAKRLEEEKRIGTLKAQETALSDHILNSFSKGDVEGARGKVATASVSRQTVAQVQDWEAFYKYVAKEGAFDLLQRRVNDSAYRARLDDQIKVPGVEPFGVVKLSITKSGK